MFVCSSAEEQQNDKHIHPKTARPLPVWRRGVRCLCSTHSVYRQVSTHKCFCITLLCPALTWGHDCSKHCCDPSVCLVCSIPIVQRRVHFWKMVYTDHNYDHQKWPKGQWSCRHRYFRSIHQVATFLLREAMLSAVYAVVVCLCVCVCLSVCLLSVTLRYCIKTAKCRITQTTPHDSPMILVFWCQRSWRNSNGISSYGGDKCWWGGLKLVTFDEKRAITRKRYKIDV